jgi:hypothetical protein
MIDSGASSVFVDLDIARRCNRTYTPLTRFTALADYES